MTIVGSEDVEQLGNKILPRGQGRACRQGGFTLVELMIVVVIVAILATVAFPSYQSHMRKARRSNAEGALMDAASRQEQFFLDNRTYTTTIGGGGLNMQPTTEGGHYALAVDAATAACPINRCYSLRATPQGAQAADTCGVLTLASGGDKGPAGCW